MRSSLRLRAMRAGVRLRAPAAAFAAWKPSWQRSVSSSLLLFVLPPPWRKIRSDLALHAQCDPLRMAAIHDGHVHAAFARQFGGAQFGNHASASQRAFAVAL